MKYPKILTIQDISCVGQCSLTAALPILSAMGAETCILPSAVLSTHTGGFTGYTFRDLTDDMPAIAAHWQKEGIRFDAVYTGYLGSARQIEYVLDIVRSLRKDGAPFIADPAMADGGKLYKGFDDAYVEAMKPLCFGADVILPNLTEACLLTGIPYREDYDDAYIRTLCETLHGNGAKTVVLTGVHLHEKYPAYPEHSELTGVVIYDGETLRCYPHRRIDRSCHGTGDVFASVFTGAYVQGISPYQAAAFAAEFTVRSIEHTVDDPDHWYGVKFETQLPWLCETLGKELA